MSAVTSQTGVYPPQATMPPTVNDFQTDARPTPEQWSIPWLIVMHLLPGLLIAGTFAVISWYTRGLHVSALLTMSIAIPLALLPAELGYLLYQGKRLHGRFTLRGVIAYNRTLPGREYAIWIPITLLATIVLFVLLGPIDSVVMTQFFAWWPHWMNPDFGSFAALSPRALWITVALLMIFGNWVGPLVEELYFRGYLLPRMEYLGRWGVVLNGALFALYHFWSPWHFVSRAIGILPLCFITRRKRNVVIPIVVHCTLNTVGTLLAVAAIL